MTGNDALATAAVESATSVSQAAPVSDEAQLAVLVADAFTQVFAGRFVRAADPVAEARALAERLGQRHNRVRVDVADTLRAIHLGDLAGAHALVDDALHLADVAGVRPAHVVWLGLAAQLAQIEGRLDRAQRRLREAVRAADHVDDFAAGGFVRGDLNALRVELGVDESLDESGSPIGQARARIRLAEPADADALAAELAAATADAGYLVWAPWIAREAVRRGPAPRSTALLESWAAEVDGPVVARFARHGRAVLDGDVAVLDALADESDATGFVLPGVEVLLDALELDPVPGDPVARRRRVLDLLARAAGVGPTVPPQLAARIESVVDAAEMPSGRQLEVARLVAAGRTSKEVAAELVVSVRTVDNHLAAVYRKLGVSSRHELADLPLPGR